MIETQKPLLNRGESVWINAHWRDGVVECFVPDLWCPVHGHSPHYGVRVNDDYLVWVPQHAIEKTNQPKEVTA
jgi:hypothetical protein